MSQTTWYFVRKVEICTKCNGKQFVQHPAWNEYWSAHVGQFEDKSLEYDIQWFEDHGWSSSLEKRRGFVYLPDEEVVCSDCEGEGEIESEVNLLDVLPELLESLRTKE